MRLAAGTALTLALLTSVACGTPDEPGITTSETDPVTATPTSTASASDDGEETEPPAADGDSGPELPAEAREQTEAGAQAFVEHYFEVLNRMAAEPQLGVLDVLASPTCQPCDAMVTAVDAMAEESQVATGPFADVEVLEAMLVNRGAGVEIEVDWLVPDIVDASGSAVSSAPEGAEGQLLVEMTYVGDRWVITRMMSGSLP